MNTIKNTINKLTGRGDETTPVTDQQYTTTPVTDQHYTTTTATPVVGEQYHTTPVVGDHHHTKKETSDERHEKAYGLGKHGPRHQPGDAQYYETGTGRVYAAAGHSPTEMIQPSSTSDVGVPIIPNPSDKLDTGYGRTGYVAPDVGAIGTGAQGYTPGMGVMSDMGTTGYTSSGGAGVASDLGTGTKGYTSSTPGVASDIGTTGHTAPGATGVMSNIGSSGYTTSHTTDNYTGPMGATGVTDSTAYRGTTSDSTPTGYEMGHTRPAHGPTMTDKIKGTANKVTTAAREGIAKAKDTYHSQP